MRDYMNRRVTPTKQVISPTWDPPPPCKKRPLGPLDSFATYAYSCRVCPVKFFTVVFRLKKPVGKCDSHTCMLRMNPRIVILVSNPKQHLAIGPSLAPFHGSEMLCHLILGAPKSVDAFKHS